MYEKYRRKCKGHMKYSEKVEYTCLLKTGKGEEVERNKSNI